MNLPLLLEPEQLQDALGDDRLLIVDLRPFDVYRQGHLPGAVQLDYTDLIHAEPPAGGLLPSADRLSTVLAAIGLESGRHVVAYDDEGCGRASRLLWTLDALGHPGLSLLNGGFVSWSEENRPLDQDSSTPRPSNYRAALANRAVVADKDYILSRLQADDFVPLDTRTPSEYQGMDVRAARGGHIPGAVNFNWLDAIDRGRATRFKPDAELRAALADLGVTEDKEIVAYCQTHHRSSHTYMVLKHLGFPRLRGYPGAWSEWGNAQDTPVEC